MMPTRSSCSCFARMFLSNRYFAAKFSQSRLECLGIGAIIDRRVGLRAHCGKQPVSRAGIQSLIARQATSAMRNALNGSTLSGVWLTASLYGGVYDT
jgi:hypothetical protein